MKKELVLLLVFLLVSTGNCFSMAYTRAGQHMALLGENKARELIATPDIKKYIAAYGAGYALSLGSIAMGNKFIPSMGVIRVGRISIPVKPFVNLASSYVVGYAPLVSYLYLKKFTNQPFIETGAILPEAP